MTKIEVYNQHWLPKRYVSTADRAVGLIGVMFVRHLPETAFRHLEANAGDKIDQL